MLERLRPAIPISIAAATAAILLSATIISCGGAPSPASGPTSRMRLPRPVIEAYVDSMFTGERSHRSAYADTLDRLADPRTAAILLDRLGSADPSVRHGAANALFSGGLSGGVDSLLSGMRDPSPFTRWAVVRALGNHRNVVGDSLIIRAMEDSSAIVRRAAALSAGLHADTLFLPALTAALRDQAEEVRAAAALSLARVGPEADSLLLRAVEEDSGLALAGAIEALGERRASEAVPLLGVAMLDGSADVRLAAAQALGSIGGEQATLLLRAAALDDPAPLVREAAVRAVAQSSAGLIVGIVNEASGSERDVFVRLAWVEALRRAATEESERLLRSLAESDPSLDVKAAAAEALRR